VLSEPIGVQGLIKKDVSEIIKRLTINTIDTEMKDRVQAPKSLQ